MENSNESVVEKQMFVHRILPEPDGITGGGMDSPMAMEQDSFQGST